ncbi:MAG: UvrB/UvrC motif-containing protein [Planctomycetota bacterium]|nr:UvrB/UvrC motif-containing protein [Planctomycetota bacterium]
MKCQQCEKPATIHITEITGPELDELHLCEDCGKIYLSQQEPVSDSTMSPQFKLIEDADELAALQQQVCEICGSSFYEFRHSGRLGCPHDYVCFEAELEPLIVNIHAATEHVGKRPKRGVNSSEQQAHLVRMRQEMKEAIEREDYETASSLRDQIQELEKLRKPS